MDKPEKLKDKHLEYLDALRESGDTNMYGAPWFLREEYPELNRKESHEILKYWMKNFKLKSEVA
ncbi:hypothetical protein LCGC14_0452120 [marine sediment metagenome]|uniref:Uncharacterized protein n=1 Tax=marine sediment metagenome TaxID=412755 RepID=A0A0F9V4A7_9ZZZZ